MKIHPNIVCRRLFRVLLFHNKCLKLLGNSNQNNFSYYEYGGPFLLIQVELYFIQYRFWSFIRINYFCYMKARIT